MSDTLHAGDTVEVQALTVDDDGNATNVDSFSADVTYDPYGADTTVSTSITNPNVGEYLVTFDAADAGYYTVRTTAEKASVTDVERADFHVRQ